MVWRTLVLVALAAATACSNTTRDPVKEAQLILEGARRCLGTATDGVETIYARAVVQGPESQFITLIWSGRDGRTRMEQSGGFVAVNHPTGAWQLDRSGAAVPLENEMLGVLAGHELHMTAIDPTSRYRDARSAGRTRFRDREALSVEFAGYRGEPVTAYYAVGDTLPLGFKQTDPEPDVVVAFDGWDTVDGVRVFRKAEIIQGLETFGYTFTDIVINGTADSTFASPSGHLK